MHPFILNLIFYPHHCISPREHRRVISNPTPILGMTSSCLLNLLDPWFYTSYIQFYTIPDYSFISYFHIFIENKMYLSHHILYLWDNKITVITISQVSIITLSLGEHTHQNLSNELQQLKKNLEAILEHPLSNADSSLLFMAQRTILFANYPSREVLRKVRLRITPKASKTSVCYLCFLFYVYTTEIFIKIYV